jgi:hypothetical protein
MHGRGHLRQLTNAFNIQMFSARVKHDLLCFLVHSFSQNIFRSKEAHGKDIDPTSRRFSGLPFVDFRINSRVINQEAKGPSASFNFLPKDSL